jgi:hypothetical protein
MSETLSVNSLKRPLGRLFTRECNGRPAVSHFRPFGSRHGVRDLARLLRRASGAEKMAPQIPGRRSLWNSF